MNTYLPEMLTFNSKGAGVFCPVSFAISGYALIYYSETYLYFEVSSPAFEYPNA
jgi:hypothetical protein